MIGLLINRRGVFCRFAMLSCLAAICLFIGCKSERPAVQGQMPDKAMIQSRDDAVGDLISSCSALLKPLQGLDNEEQTAVISLVVLSNIATWYESSGSKVNKLIITQLDRSFNQLPSSMQPVRSAGYIFMQCWDESIAYIGALQDCQKDGREEEDCPEAWGPATAEIYCTMKALEELKPIFPEIFGGRIPPGPQPPLVR